MAEYSRLAAQYDSRWSFYVAETTRETVARLNLRSTERLLDVGCGTGALLTHATEIGAERFGVDAVAAMLSVARKKLPSRANLCAGWAECLPFADGCFDVIVSCNMFHYISAPTAALTEMRRVLRPSGRIVITDWCDDFWACRMCGLYLRLFGRAHFRAYRRREFVRLLEQAGYVVASAETYKINWLWGLMTVVATPTADKPRF